MGAEHPDQIQMKKVPMPEESPFDRFAAYPLPAALLQDVRVLEIRARTGMARGELFFIEDQVGAGNLAQIAHELAATP